MQHRRTAATITALAIAAFSLAACNDGATVNDKPKAKAPATTESSEPATAADPSPAPDVAKVGDTIALTGMEGGKLDVTAVKFVDPAKPGDDFTEPGSGKRFVGVQFQLVNTGTTAYSDSPINGAQIADEQGQQFQPIFADISAGPSMASEVRLKPGAKALGWITFEVPQDVKLSTVQFAMDSGFADQTGEWKLH
ncbi:DUF4352 domain-containing protein [Streptomyces sp. bgisy154]|uniref:DUF4352 domain-containing protein n=1 Tax=Streptomyces sp. bgisy154 TaxID=3413794 RepID=UPI003D725D73